MILTLICRYNTCRRGKMREHYGIDGNFCLDCLSSCCSCCALIQQERESYAREQHFKAEGAGRNVVSRAGFLTFVHLYQDFCRLHV